MDHAAPGFIVELVVVDLLHSMFVSSLAKTRSCTNMHPDLNVLCSFGL